MKKNVLWKVIPSFKRYEVSEFGDVRIKKKSTTKNARGGYPIGYILKCKKHHKSKYNTYKLCDNFGKRKTVYSHVLVCEAFNGKRLDGQIIRHLDGNCYNNHFLNLKYGTAKENVHDSIKHNTFFGGAYGKNNNFSLTTKHREYWKFLRSLAFSYQEIADFYNCHRTLVSKVVNDVQ